MIREQVAVAVPAITNYHAAAVGAGEPRARRGTLRRGGGGSEMRQEHAKRGEEEEDEEWPPPPVGGEEIWH